ncbi:hypothetical protein K0M31_013494, partial [Melipona bicolor]
MPLIDQHPLDKRVQASKMNESVEQQELPAANCGIKITLQLLTRVRERYLRSTLGFLRTHMQRRKSPLC